MVLHSYARICITCLFTIFTSAASIAYCCKDLYRTPVRTCTKTGTRIAYITAPAEAVRVRLADYKTRVLAQNHLEGRQLNSTRFSIGSRVVGYPTRLAGRANLY